jgi:hypothetical protein
MTSLQPDQWITSTNKQIVNDTGTPRIFATSSLDVWNVLVTTRRANALARNALVMSGASSALEFTLPTIRAVRSTKTYKKTYPPLWQKQYTPPTPLQKTVHVQPGVTPKLQSKISAILPTLPISPTSLSDCSTRGFTCHATCKLLPSPLAVSTLAFYVQIKHCTLP